jgi:hypothetical protein
MWSDPRLWPPDLPPDATRCLQLSDRIDCYCLLDAQDHEWARHWLWRHTFGSGALHPETGVIARPDHIYAIRSVGRTLEYLHRTILTRAEGPPPEPGMIGDHRNGDTLDNRRCNLRWASKSMNAKNRPQHRRWA